MKRHLIIWMACAFVCIGLTGFGQSCTGNLFINSGFESNLVSWNNLGTASIVTDAHSGTKALKVCGNNGDSRVIQAFPVTPGQSLNLSFWAKKTGVSGFVRVKTLTANYQPTTLFAINVSSATWQAHSSSILIPAGAAFLEIGAEVSNAAATECAFFDDFCLTGGTIPNCNIAGTAVASACNNSGTPNNPADDVFNMTVTVSGVTSGWTGTLFNGQTNIIGSGSQPASFEFLVSAIQPYLINGVLPIELRSDADPNCYANIFMTPPTPCTTAPPDQGCYFEKTFPAMAGFTQSFSMVAKENTDGSFSAKLTTSPNATTYNVSRLDVDAAGNYITSVLLGSNLPSGVNYIEDGYMTDNYVQGNNSNQLTVTRFNYAGGQVWQKAYTITGASSIAAPVSKTSVTGGFLYMGVVTKTGQPLNQFYPFTMKVDAQGNVLWQNTWTTTIASPGSVALRAEAIGGGYFLEVLQPSNQNTRVAKINASGVFQWDFDQTSGTNVYLFDVSESPNGQSVYAAFQFTSNGSTWVKLVQLNANGSFVWEKLNPGIQPVAGAFHMAPSVVATNDGAVVAFRSSYPTGAPLNRFNYAKLNLNGDAVWSKYKADIIAEVYARTSDGGYLFGGTGLTNNGVPYLLKTTANGNETPACLGGPVLPDIHAKTCLNYIGFLNGSNLGLGNIAAGGTVSTQSCSQTVQNLVAPNTTISFVNKLYLSTDNSLSANDVLLATQTVSTVIAGCGANCFYTEETIPTANVPANIASGQYFMIIKSDADNQVTESDENDNLSVPYPVTVISSGGSGQIDLSLALQQLTASPAQWSNYPVKLTISNAGPQVATGVKVKFAKPTGVVYVGGNQFTASQGSFNPNGDEVWTVGSIPANGSATLTVNYFLLNATAPVAYAQVTAANETDSDSQPNNGTPPTPVQDDEASTAGGTTPTLPDITLSTVTSPPGGTVAAGAAYSINFVPTNPGGTIPAAQLPVTGRFYLSVDNVLSANDILVGTSANVPINGTPQSISGTVPANTAAGQYYAIVQLDPANTVTESNENNNVAASALTITVTGGSSSQPDLTIADLQIPTASVAAGAILSYNFDASNAGAAAVPGSFTIKSFISTDQTLSTNDVQDGTIQTGNYAAGFSVQNVPGASTIPASLAAGQYYLIVKMDGDNIVAESNENNNTVVKPFTVTAPSTGGNCEQVLSQEPMVCARPLTNGNIEVGTGVQVYFSPYKLFEYGPNGSLVNDTPDPNLLSIPAFVTIIQNGNSIATLETATGAITGVTPLPTSITSTITNLVVCAKAGTSSYFLAGTRTSDNRVVVMLLNVGSNGNVTIASTLNTNGGGFANDIVSTTWGGAILGRSNNTTTSSSPGGSIHVISSTNTLLYSVTKGTNPFTFKRLPCGGDNAYRVSSQLFGAGGGSSVQYSYEEDYMFTQQAATLWPTRKPGVSLNSPVPPISLTEHTFYNADGTKWVVTRKSQEAAPQYGVLALDTMYYEKFSATNALLLSQALDKTKFDALTDLRLLAVAEVQPGKLAFFGNKGGAAWYYNPFCGGGNQQADLTASALQLSATSVAVGGNFNFTFMEFNAGSAAAAAFGRKSYISTDNVLSANDILATSTTSTGLLAGVNNPVTQTVVLPASLASGNYFLIVKVDADNTIVESNENNNTVSAPFTVTTGGGGGTPDCNAITITPAPGKITIAGFSAPHVLIKVFKPNWTVAFECLDGACSNPLVVNNLTAGTYHLQIKLLNANWGEICFRQQDVNVSSFGGGGSSIAKQEDERFRLAFDKFYPNPATYSTNMELYSPVKQAATLDFYDRTGRLVHTQKVELEEGQNLIEHLVYDWKSGTYNVVARGEETGLPAYGRFLKVWEE